MIHNAAQPQMAPLERRLGMHYTTLSTTAFIRIIAFCLNWEGGLVGNRTNPGYLGRTSSLYVSNLTVVFLPATILLELL